MQGATGLLQSSRGTLLIKGAICAILMGQGSVSRDAPSRCFGKGLRTSGLGHTIRRLQKG